MSLAKAWKKAAKLREKGVLHWYACYSKQLVRAERLERKVKALERDLTELAQKGAA